MPLAAGGIFACQGEGTQICQDQRIHTGVIQLFQIGGQTGDLFVAGHGVHSHMDLDTVVVGKGNGYRQLLRGEIPRKGTHAEIRPCQIDRVCAVKNGHFQPFHIPCGAQQFDLSHQ